MTLDEFTNKWRGRNKTFPFIVTAHDYHDIPFLAIHAEFFTGKKAQGVELGFDGHEYVGVILDEDTKDCLPFIEDDFRYHLSYDNDPRPS